MNLIENASYCSKKQLAMLNQISYIKWKESFQNEREYIERFCDMLDKFKIIDVLEYESEPEAFDYSESERELVENIESLFVLINDYAYNNFIEPFKDTKSKCTGFFVKYKDKYIKISWSDFKIDIGAYSWYKAEFVSKSDIITEHLVNFEDILEKKESVQRELKLKSLSSFSEAMNKALVDGVPVSRIVEEIETILWNYNNNT